MRRTTWIMASGLIIVGAVSSAVFARHVVGPQDVRRASDERKPAEEGLQDLRDQMAALQQAVAANDRHIMTVALAARGEPAPSASATTQREAPPSPPLTQEERAKRQADVLHLIDDTVKFEPRDRSWAPAYEGDLRKAVLAAASVEQPVKLDSVECRTTLCRIEVSHGAQGEQGDIIKQLQPHLPPMTAAHWTHTPGADGTVKTTVDIIREGYPVPG